MRQRITEVERGSVAEVAGLLSGDELLSIDGREVRDLIDYQAFCCKRRLRLICARNGGEKVYTIRKGEYEPLGLRFALPLMSAQRSCANRCVFCFEAQNPKGARDSLVSRDDDWRLSLMTGSYVTLTNVDDRELRRIIARHASPLYISVHAVDGDLRARMMGNPRAARIMDQLRALRDGNIAFHAQTVVCPGFNDGDALEKTIHDLFALRPAALSLAVVPVGLTCHREGLEPLRAFSAADADALLAICARWRGICRDACGDPFVYPSDELYLLAGQPVPEDGEYGEYSQIENGVGMLRLLADEFAAARDGDDAPLPDSRIRRRALIATGELAAPFLARLVAENPVSGVDVRVTPVSNEYFGDSVTVAGLLTGSDLLNDWNEIAHMKADAILITECMLREGDNVFLDGMTVDDVSRALGVPVVPVARGGDALYNALKDVGRGVISRSAPNME